MVRAHVSPDVETRMPIFIFVLIKLRQPMASPAVSFIKD
jgi:hypothetical protein